MTPFHNVSEEGRAAGRRGGPVQTVAQERPKEDRKGALEHDVVRGFYFATNRTLLRL